MREPLLISDEAIRLGILTFVATIRGNNHHIIGALFRCDCGRMVRVSERLVRSLKGGRMADLPWSCEECDYTIPDPKEARPTRPWNTRLWIKQDQETRDHRLADYHIPDCDKTIHPDEWFAWQQAKRVSKGVVRRWKQFSNFYKDMGDRPPGTRLAKKDKSRRHGPGNSFWYRTTQLVWNQTPVTAVWVTDEFGIPPDYILACKRAGWLDVRPILARFRMGYPPPKKGDKQPTSETPQFLD